MDYIEASLFLDKPRDDFGSIAPVCQRQLGFLSFNSSTCV